MPGRMKVHIMEYPPRARQRIICRNVRSLVLIIAMGVLPTLNECTIYGEDNEVRGWQGLCDDIFNNRWTKEFCPYHREKATYWHARSRQIQAMLSRYYVESLNISRQISSTNISLPLTIPLPLLPSPPPNPTHLLHSSSITPNSVLASSTISSILISFLLYPNGSSN